MTVEIALVLIIIGGALYLFASERLPLDITALLILVTVMAIPLLFHSEWLMARGIDLESAFPTIPESLSGLSSTATVTVLCMFILSAGIQRSGLVHVLGKRLFPLVGNSEIRQLLIIAVLVGPISGFINNTAAVAIAIPLVLDMARRSDTQASRLLMPVSFFGMLGGTLTLIGTSTNILASSILKQDPSFGREIGMFEFTHLGLIVLGVGLVYFLTIGRLLMPKKDAVPIVGKEEKCYVIEILVDKTSAFVGKSLDDSKFLEKTATEVLRLVRGATSHIKRATETVVEEGDILHVRADMRQIMDFMKMDGVIILSEFGESKKVRSDGMLVPVLLRNRVVFAGHTAEEVNFWERYKARLIGFDIEKSSSKRLSAEKLHVGEVVLFEISQTNLERLRGNSDVVVLGEFEDDFDTRNMWVAGGIIAAVVVAAAITPLPIVATAVVGVIAMVVSGCVNKQDMYSGVSWDVIFLLAGVIPLGIAMTKSGAADWVSGLLAVYAGGWHPLAVLMSLYLLTTLTTELVSNNAAVVVLVPVAISLSQLIGMDSYSLVLAVMFAASTSFLSPIGYQTNTMIYGTGVFKFTDFAKVGAPLNLLLMIVTCTCIWLIG